MRISEFSVIMSIACSSLILFAAGFLVSHVKRVRWGFVLLILVLGFARLVFPIELHATKEIMSWEIYPMLIQLVHRKLIGNWTLAGILLFIWGIGAIIFFLSFLREIRTFKEMSERAIPVMERDPLFQICEKAKEELGYNKPVRLAVTGELDTAVSIGFLTPNVLIPKEMLTYSETELKGVLKHEIIHYLRRDVGKQRVMFFLQILFWWNPVLYYLRNCVENMLELECDEHACQGMSEEERKVYLKAIAKVLRGDDKKHSRLGLGWKKKFPIKFYRRRFQEVLQPVKRLSNVVTYLLAFVSLVLFCLSYSIIVQPGNMPEEAESREVSQEMFIKEKEDKEFLIKLSDGTYQYVSNMLVRKTLTENDVQKAPYADLPVYYNTGKGE